MIGDSESSQLSLAVVQEREQLRDHSEWAMYNGADGEAVPAGNGTVVQPRRQGVRFRAGARRSVIVQADSEVNNEKVKNEKRAAGGTHDGLRGSQTHRPVASSPPHLHIENLVGLGRRKIADHRRRRGAAEDVAVRVDEAPFSWKMPEPRRAEVVPLSIAQRKHMLLSTSVEAQLPLDTQRRVCHLHLRSSILAEADKEPIIKRKPRVQPVKTKRVLTNFSEKLASDAGQKLEVLPEPLHKLWFKQEEQVPAELPAEQLIPQPASGSQRPAAKVLRLTAEAPAPRVGAHYYGM